MSDLHTDTSRPSSITVRRLPVEEQDSCNACYYPTAPGTYAVQVRALTIRLCPTHLAELHDRLVYVEDAT